jgi:DNA-binding response OmpR family regulator
LLLSDDLLFGTQAAQHIRDAGYEVRRLSEPAELLVVGLEHVRLVVVDLNTPGFAAEPTADRLRAAAVPPELIAIGQHVQQIKLQVARDAGWRVLTRGQFHAAAATLLPRADAAE